MSPLLLSKFVFTTIPREHVKLFVCGDDFLEVFVEAVRVGDSHLVDGLFPSGDFPTFDKAAS